MIVRLAWYARRLSRMTPVEIVGRIRDQAVKRRLRRRRLRSAAADRLVPPPEIPPFATPLPPLDIENIPAGARNRVGLTMPAGRSALRIGKYKASLER